MPVHLAETEKLNQLRRQGFTHHNPNFSMGKQRYFNSADLIVLVSINVVRITSGAFNNLATVIPTNQANLFINSTPSARKFIPSLPLCPCRSM